MPWKSRVSEACVQEAVDRAKDEEKGRSLAEWVAGAPARAEAAVRRREKRLADRLDNRERREALGCGER